MSAGLPDECPTIRALDGGGQGGGAMRHHVRVARCNCGAMDKWPDGCHHWTAVCTCGWSDDDADDQPGGIDAAYWHLAHRMTLENVKEQVK